MALLFLKTILLPRNGQTSYSRVGTSSPVDCERGSMDSNRTEFDEKRKYHQEHPSGIRINPRIISDATIGLSDGLTVPFALTAGLSALGSTNVVIYGGFAELVAGGISMGLGGYLGARSEAEAYHAALAETRTVVETNRDQATNMIRSTFSKYDFSEQTLSCMTTTLLAEPDNTVDFLMRFHHHLAEDDFAASRAYISGLTISLGYFLGGLIPLMPYLFFSDMQHAFMCSVIVMALALFVFGWAKTSFVGELDSRVCFRNGLQMVVLGGVAAGAAMGCVKAVGG